MQWSATVLKCLYVICNRLISLKSRLHLWLNLGLSKPFADNSIIGWYTELCFIVLIAILTLS